MCRKVILLLVTILIGITVQSKTTAKRKVKTKPNIIVYFADDISAREFPAYQSSVWSDLRGKNTSDQTFRAQTPVLDRLAKEGVVIKNAWAATVCNPSRAMMMTGRYAHIHKWWHNKDKGVYRDENGKVNTWPPYESSPMLIGHVGQKAGYGTYWAGKTQMAGDLTRYGFDEGCFTPGGLSDKDNPYTDFKHYYKKINGERVLINADTGEPCETYMQHGWYWYPHVKLMNDPSSKETFCWWPNTEEAKKNFGINTYGPDVELDFAFKFMERKQKEGKPFFIYHTTHLGHDAFDWFNPKQTTYKWPSTPKVNWDGEKYSRTEPKITGDNGVYNTHGTVSKPGIYNHIKYIDYQIWQYLNKLKEMEIDDNTILIISADNGTSGYGKASPDKQKGCHVPFIVYAPGFDFTKKGMQDVRLNIADVLPTLAEIMEVEIPEDYEINGESFWGYLTTDKKDHRDWVYAYRNNMQLVRGNKVMKDGRDKWWDITTSPEDLISFREIKNWDKESKAYRKERDELLETIKPFDKHAVEHDAPGFKK